MSDSDTEDSDTATGSPTRSTIDSQWQDSLVQCLDRIEPTGDFAASQQYSVFPNPGLQIGQDRFISLPLTPTDAEAIKARATQATYGVDNQNVVDTSVRKTWELQPDSFRLANPEWESYFESHILRRAADGLGLQNVEGHLQKLLLYDEGSFFKPHRDAQTEAGMVGTLVVSLPSKHKGGEVHLSFRSEKKTLATDTTPPWDLTVLSWFSDVAHEVAELTDGYRLVLTYKLVQTDGPLRSAEHFHQQLEGLRSVLKEWDETHNNPMYYLLDHQYSGKTLSIATMKGRDHGVCRVLHDACADTKFLVFVAHLTHYAPDDDTEQTYLKDVYTCNGEKLGRNPLYIDKSHILTPNPFDGDPDEHEWGGYREGYDHCHGYSKYYFTVAMLVPRRGLDVFRRAISTDQEAERWVTLADDQLRNHWDSDVQSAAMKIFHRCVQREPFDLGPASIQTILYWALKFNDTILYHDAGRFGLQSPDTQGTVLAIIGQHLKCRPLHSIETEANLSETDWGEWFEHFAAHCPFEIFQQVVELFPSYLESEHLRVLFKAWGQVRLDQARLDGLATIQRKLDAGRNRRIRIAPYHLRNPTYCYESDLLEAERNRYFALLKECLSLGAVEQAMRLLDATSQRLEPSKYRNPFDGSTVVLKLLLPLTTLLDKYGLNDLTPPVRRLFVTVIQGGLFQQLPKKESQPAAYNDAVDVLRTVLAPLQGEFLRSALGEDCYREVITLESMRLENSHQETPRQ